VIIKGNSCSGAGRLAVHLTRTDTNERAEVTELRGVAAEDLRGALQEMEAIASGTRCSKPFYHASIDPRADERLTEEQWTKSIDRLEAELGLTGQPRVVVAHKKEGRDHRHIVWSRVDVDRMRTISDSHNYRKHEIVARELERDFGHERVQGVHIERDGQPRPERTPSHAEMLQSERTGLSPQKVKEQVTDIWRRTDNGSAFAVALWEEGFTICRGDRRDFVLIDPMGGTHSLARCVEGARTKDIRARMADLDPAHLPSVAQGKQYQLDRRDIYLEREQARLEEEGRPKTTDTQNEWTQRGGMVEQQRAAMDWVKQAEDHKAARTEQTDRKQGRSEATEATTKRREALLREFGRDLDHELGPSDQDRGQELSRR
jgi:hypothetical protein